MNEHSHVVIDANGQDRTDCFLHLTEFCSCGSSKTVLHNQDMVEKMMSQRKTNANEKKAATTVTNKPQFIFFFWMETTNQMRLDILEMPSGEHNGETIA